MPSAMSQSKERKGSNFAIWQPCTYILVLAIDRPTVSAALRQVAQFAQDAGVAGRVELQVGPRFV